MELGKNHTGLTPTNFMNEPKKAKIVGSVDNPNSCLNEETKISKSGQEYKVYTLWIELDKELKSIPYLMRNQLNQLVDTYGTEPDTWIGQCVELFGVKKGDFTNFSLKPFPITGEEAEVVE